MDDLNHITKIGEQIRLTQAERSRMREVLESRMRSNPVAYPSPYQRFFAFSGAALALGVLFVVIGLQNTLTPEASLQEASAPDARTMSAPASFKSELMIEADTGIDVATTTATSTPLQ
jgi:hypothetical protein